MLGFLLVIVVFSLVLKDAVHNDMKNKEQIKKVIWNAFPETSTPVGNILNTSNNQYEDYEGNCVKNFFSGKKTLM